MSMETVLNMISSLAPPSLAPPPDVSAHSAASAGPMLVDTAMAATAAAQLNSPRSHSSTASAGGPAMALASPIGASSSSATSTSSVVVAQMVSPTSRAATMAALPAQTPPPTAQRSRTFFRAPGLEAPDESAGAEFPTNALVCPDCGFSCSSKFHYNSHRNTHSKHQCPMCNFETRTEGRLKKHILQSHKREDRLAHGITISSPPPPPAQPQQQQQLHSPRQQHTEADNKCLLGPQPQMMMGGTPTSMGNLLSSMLSTADQSAANGSMALESLQSMLNNTNPLAQFSNSTDALLKICTDAIANNGPNEKAYSSPQMGDHLGAGGGHHHHHIPLEQLRALTERHTASLLATSTAANGVGLNFGELHIGAMNGCGENGQAQVALLEPKQETPQRRSGKPKRYKCKQCAHISRSKEENWAHSKQHIPKQKQLTCTLCDFVTEYKHHLEYHYRNHNGQKPFKCTICDYSCVNKSMLNSHMKSHTPVYQFRCQDCTYQTKYCHSLKMHLKKYNHKRAPGPGGFMDSSGEERPENASGSSIGREDIASFETSAANMAAQNGTDGGAEMGGGQHHHHHAATAALMLPPQLIGAGQHQEMEMDSQRMMLKQQLEQMNELIRNAMVNCPHCSFSTGNIDEMNRHLLFHLIATQQQMPPTLNNEQHALASIYQRLTAQLQHELVPSDAQQQQQQQEVSALLGRAFAAPSGATQNGGGDREMEQLHTGAGMGISDEDRARQMERDAAESIRQQQQQQQGQQQHFTPTTMAALLAAASQQSCSSSAAAGPDSGGECLTGGTTTSSTPSASNDLAGLQSHSAASMKREYPFGAELHARAMAEANNGGAAEMMMQDNKSAQVGGTCVIKSVMPTLISSIPGLTGNNGFGGGGSEANNNTNGYGVVGPQHFSNVQSPSSSASLPYYCQQCEIAFKDAALYQVHRGFHARESPFKCNICGHLSCSALDFNLHLYQAKHE